MRLPSPDSSGTLPSVLEANGEPEALPAVQAILGRLWQASCAYWTTAVVVKVDDCIRSLRGFDRKEERFAEAQRYGEPVIQFVNASRICSLKSPLPDDFGWSFR